MCDCGPHNGHSCNSVLHAAERKISSLDTSGDQPLRDVTILSINFSIVRGKRERGREGEREREREREGESYGRE